jgi:hypothetical protein
MRGILFWVFFLIWILVAGEYCGALGILWLTARVWVAGGTDARTR